MATTTRLITVEEHSCIPDPPGGRYELRHGELVLMSFPPKYHAAIQDTICDELKRRCGTGYYIRTEFACRPLPEYELWAIDVALTTRERWDAMEDRDWLSGSPELAIEILSPSNSKLEMEDRRETLFRGGCRQFWEVDYDRRMVSVFLPGGANKTYSEAEEIPLAPFAPGSLSVAAIFSDIK